MKIRFRKKSQGEWLVLFVLSMPFLFFVLMGIIGLPSMVKYLVDLGWLALLVLLLRYGMRSRMKQVRKLLGLIIVFWIYTLIGYILNYQSALYYLWGLRNNMRFFVFFFACVVFLREKSVWDYLRLFDVIFWINLVLALYQHFVLGYRQDYLGGVFGTEVGCNGYLNIFMIIVIAKSLLCYLSKEEKFTDFAMKFLSSVIIAALAELKVFFVEIILIFALAILLTRRTNRKIRIILLIVVGIIVGVQIITVLFPNFSGWFSVSSILDNLTDKRGYNGKGSVNRLTAIPIVMKKFLPSLGKKLFGLGLGNCDYAAYSFLQTPFYRANGGLRYQWFSSSMLVLETGIVGLVMYILFFARIYVAVSKREKTGNADPKLCQLAKIMVVMAFLMLIYNSSLRTEAAFMMYFVLALPFVRDVPQLKDRIQKEL